MIEDRRMATHTTSSAFVFSISESGLCLATSMIVSTIRHASRNDAATDFKYVVVDISRAWDNKVVM